MRNLEVLSLSVNKCVSVGGALARAVARTTSEQTPARRVSLPPPRRRISTLRDLAGCAALQELYLRKNEIADLSEVRHLRHCHALRVLWLCDNPCAAAPDYRARCVRLRWPRARGLARKRPARGCPRVRRSARF